MLEIWMTYAPLISIIIVILAWILIHSIHNLKFHHNKYENVGKIKEHYGVKYRVYQYHSGTWFWETRKWFVWENYPHACYRSEEYAEQCAKNCIEREVKSGTF